MCLGAICFEVLPAICSEEVAPLQPGFLLAIGDILLLGVVAP